MKVRKEKSGLHLFERTSGTHILFDEINIEDNDYILSPRTVSISLTNRCNLNCDFCYSKKGEQLADMEFLKEFCKKLDELGVLEITLGGGEPFVYPNLIEFCRWVWANTSLGINITTNGTLINSEHVESLKNSVSSVRLSVDAIGRNYEFIRNASFDKIEQSLLLLKDHISTSINCTVLKGKVDNLEEVIKFAIKNNVNDVLIIAQHDNGSNMLPPKELNMIGSTILKYQDKIQLNVTEALGRSLNINILPDESSEEFSFSHLSVDRKIKQNSFTDDGILVEDINDLHKVFMEQYKKMQRRIA